MFIRGQIRTVSGVELTPNKRNSCSFTAHIGLSIVIYVLDIISIIIIIMLYNHFFLNESVVTSILFYIEFIQGHKGKIG